MTQLIKIGGKEYTLEEIQVLEKAGVLNVGAKHDTSSATPSAQALNGPFPGNNSQFGVFSGAGVRPGSFSTLARVDSVLRFIPFFRSVNYNELIEIMTGVTEGSGSNATGSCATAPKAGDFKVMRQNSTFGIIHEGTKVDDITQAGMRRDYADIDRELYNLSMAENPLLPQVPGIDGQSVATSKLRASMFTLGVDIERNASRVFWSGTAGTEDNTYRGIARQWAGIESLVKTGYTDSVTGVVAPAADSMVKSYNALITGTDSASRNFVTGLTDLVYSMIARAEALQMPGVQWALVMRRDLFREAAKQIAADLPTYTSAGTTASPMMRDAQAVQMSFVDMFNNGYLLIDGQQIRVIVDNSIPRETTANNRYKSDIFMLPLSGLGRPLLYAQYFDMGNAQAEELTNAFGIEGESRTANNGLYRVFKRVTKGCIEFDVFARLRVILEAPFLAGRLDDVWYDSYIQDRQPIPGFSYYANGGLTYRT
jgi:hypothetical protein